MNVQANNNGGATGGNRKYPNELGAFYGAARYRVKGPCFFYRYGVCTVGVHTFLV